MALTVNFSVPYLAEKLGGALTVPEAGNMSSEYEEWIASTLAAEGDAPAYEEPSLEELVQMMDDVPLQGEGWGQDPEILIAPLSLQQYWDCYWADDAPFYI